MSKEREPQDATYAVVVDDFGNDGDFASRWASVEEDDCEL